MHARASYLHQMTSRDGRDEPLHPSSKAKAVRRRNGERDPRAAGVCEAAYLDIVFEALRVVSAAGGCIGRVREEEREVAHESGALLQGKVG